MAKIVRVYFKNYEAEFCIDRPFIAEMSEQENCDDALNKLLDCMKSNVVVPALKLKATPADDKDAATHVQAEHAFVNLGNLDYIVVLDVRIYETKQSEPAK
jgi:hypothetical protein